jgi:Skp family chaperone for outer membrane proteins
MKKLIRSSLLVLAFFSTVSGASAADFKIATIDLRKVFDNYYKTVQANIASSNSLMEVRKQLNDMYAARNKRAGEYQTAVGNANDMAISAEERTKYKKSADDIALDLQIQEETITNFVYRTETKRRDDMVQHVHDLTTEILDVMKAMAKKQGYTLVLDRTAETVTGNPLVLYTSGENDLTEAVIKELNATAPAAVDTGNSTNGPPSGTNAATPPK